MREVSSRQIMELAQGHIADKGWSQRGLPPEPMPLTKMLMLTFPLVAYVMRWVMRNITLQPCFKSLLCGGWGEEEAGCFIQKGFSITISDQEKN